MGRAGSNGPKAGRSLVYSGTEGKLQDKENVPDDNTGFTTQDQKSGFYSQEMRKPRRSGKSDRHIFI